MSAITTAPTASSAPAVLATEVRMALALGRTEGKRLLRHPAYLAGVALSIAFLFLVRQLVGGSPDVPFVLWTGLGVYPIAAGTFLATFTAAVRSRRHGTDELYGTQPAAAAVRTAGHLVAVGWGVAGSIALLAVAGVWHQLWDGVLVPMPGEVVATVPHVIELAVGPLLVAFFGVLAVAVARWIPSLLALPLAAVALLVHFVTGSWGIGGTARWFLPLVTHEVQAGWVQVTPDYGYGIVASFERVALAWHDAYLVALVVSFGAVALLRHGRTRGRLLLLAGGVGAAVLTGLLQLP